MNLIILASGKGERLLPLTKNTPKPLLDMGNGVTLLEEQLFRISESAVVDDITLITGYLAEQVENKVSTLDGVNMKINTVYNPFYDTTNNFVTTWLGIQAINDDFMVTNGDNLFSSNVWKDFVENCNEDGIYLCAKKSDDLIDEDMKIIMDSHRVMKVSKDVDVDDDTLESPGLLLVRGERYRKIFLNAVNELIRDKKYFKTYWLEIFEVLYNKGVDVKAWMMKTEHRWQEVDFHHDLKQIRDSVRLQF